jgi:aminopeptidase C
MDGQCSFGPGSECEDVLHVVKDYGIVPNEVMTGLNYGTELPEHYEMDAVLKGAADALLKNPNKKLTTAWPKALKGILDAYLGECPDSGFTYKGKNYTPASYRDSYKINPDDYVTITSYTHHPFYTKFALEVGDNWRQDQAYNVPLDEFWSIFKNALENGYTATWGGDVSEIGFTRDGVAWLADAKAENGAKSDRQRLNGEDEKKADAADTTVTQPKELEASQEMRQVEFENKQSTDDHGMHAFGIAKDQWGTTYVMIKNSWGKYGKYDGIWYMSENYFKEKTEDFMVHKSAIPKDIRKKLGIE